MFKRSHWFLLSRMVITDIHQLYKPCFRDRYVSGEALSVAAMTSKKLYTTLQWNPQSFRTRVRAIQVTTVCPNNKNKLKSCFLLLVVVVSCLKKLVRKKKNG